jgi:hypothetical protein
VGGNVTGKDPADVLTADNRVRVLRKRCDTCVFKAEGREIFGEDRVTDLIDRNVAAGALLTCHSTLPYGPYPEFGPAVCAGFWARHGLKTAAGRMARFVLGMVRPMPPGEAGPE